MNDAIQGELQHRTHMWEALLNAGGPDRLTPQLLRELGVYGGAQGIWVDKARTSHLAEDGDGVTVGLLHTGRSYSDDLSDDGVIYHYPSTNRPSARDLSEVNATKSAGSLGLPVFVITHPSPGSSQRNVHLGWVEDWDDERPRAVEPVDDEPFNLEREAAVVQREVSRATGQQRFKFRVFKRYGQQCAVCGMDVMEVLDAAHIRPRSERGSDDPRNGLVLCAVHHRALDAELFAIRPDSSAICCREAGPNAESLRIVHGSLEHLRLRPHRDALTWLWKRWEKEHG